jgi:phospho-N-acetylmuramoyl-pentapeptide-transferase
MLYPLFDYLDRVLDIPGTGVFRYISFRAGMAALFSLIITITFGHHIINWIRIVKLGRRCVTWVWKAKLKRKALLQWVD